MEAEEIGSEKSAGRDVFGDSKIVDTGRLGQAFIILGAIVLFIHISLTVLSLAVPAESSWMIFNMWGINRFVTVTVVCCVMIAVGWMLCRKTGCDFLRDQSEPVPGEEDALPDVRKPQ
jgi:hypothetical protein